MGFCSDVFFCCRKTRKTSRKKKHLKKKQKYNIYQEENLNELQKVQFTHSFMQGESARKNDCQDAFAIIDNYPDLFYFFAVLDGHGSSGKEASNAACDSFQQYFENNIQKIQHLENERETDSFIRSGKNSISQQTAFKLTEKKLKFSGIDYSTSGTCCISIYIQKNKCFISNLGDSRAVMCRITPKERVAVE
jgi:integrin-linked kinase-associated serine/threonine phosphatase 2C